MTYKYQFNVLPFLISLIGVMTDFLTTNVGLGFGFYETHSTYHPVLALTIFWVALTTLSLTLPKKKIWETSKNILAATSFLGTVNNSLVILGIFSGLRI